MTTIKVSVKSGKDASLLIRLLRSLNFVSDVEEVEDADELKRTDQFSKIKAILEKVQHKEFFNDIADPQQWQKSLRNEWN